MSETNEAVPSQGKVLRGLYLKLLLRGRSSRGLNVRQNQANGSILKRFGLTLLMYFFVGFMAIRFIQAPLTGLLIYLHGATVFFVGMFIAASSGEVLFNKDENEILLHRPVDPRVLLWSKISVLLQVGLWMSLAFNLAGMFVGVAGKDGGWLFLPAHVLSSGLSALFCTAFVILVYQLCLRWFGRERLDNLMTLVQVLMTMLLVFGSQLAPRILKIIPVNIQLTEKNWWMGLLPPTWFTCLDLSLMGRGNYTEWGLAVLGVLLTGILMWLAFDKLASSYESGLRSMGDTSVRQKKGKSGLLRLEQWMEFSLVRLYLRDPVERAGFLLTAAYMLRDRDVKLRLYPGLAPILIMPVMLFVTTGDVGRNSFLLSMVSGYIAMIPFLAIQILKFSQQWQAADVFRISPITGPGAIIIGARKALELIFILPMITLLGVAMVWFTDGFGVLAYLLPGILSVPLFGRLPGLSNKNMPLGSPPENARAANRGLVVFLLMAGAMAIGMLGAAADHFGFFPHYVAVEALLVAVVCFFCDRITKALTWPSIEEEAG
ncbi:hypothetical protein JIN85_14100 [Luteolibacter pohnpeiensis]|uniref:Uncharacterized protein n=1 Tax=Luteolibacter pohnpeiensis TaxID=454153 RepID=A0A934VVG9_9BACT|nr:hypothetical protein [Luteolibacter pohnpeiensis]MBK1883552.1 hypothetical protein [Luteolibacter pohnpeiensis]